jgi:uncharacterized protein YkwD
MLGSRFTIAVAIALLVTAAFGVQVFASPLRASPPATWLQQDDAGDPLSGWLHAINQSRVDSGLAPYALNEQLRAGAQRHADDIATSGFVYEDVHRGSDGSTSKERIAEAGYEAWTWSSGVSITGENVWFGFGGIEDAMDFFMNSPPHRRNLLNATHREVGIGVAIDPQGRNAYVLTFAVQPNVLPVFIEDGAETTEDTEVQVRLTNEDARVYGAGTSQMGQAAEVRVVGEPGLLDQEEWQGWERYVEWTLPEVGGEHAIWVEFRDELGRTTVSSDTIRLVGFPPPTDTPLPPTDTPEPTATSMPSPTPTPTPTSTPAPTSTPTATPTPSPTPGPPTATPFPTWTPLPRQVVGQPGVPGNALGVVLGLQGVALVLVLCVALRRQPDRGKKGKPK